ncbi:hypothetical protein KAM348_07090 [Aeromonas caviae]|uniref:Uncharacterized protein n=1 Tax=Aeromonas caviae TaxID=648 RepID=A0AAI9KP34_AERCA|nr:hypothetical protein [Aeromonas caviae]GJA53286.1 hypothetical protein KAM348_07090 [Aeromonas caviae]
MDNKVEGTGGRMPPPSQSGSKAVYIRGSQGQRTEYFAFENVKALLNTSVADAKSSLECQLGNNPQQAMVDAQLAIDFINQGSSLSGQKSRLAMLATIVNKARKALRN